MRIADDLFHGWDVSPAEARQIQERLRGRVETQDRLDPPEYVAGVDVGFEDDGNLTRAAVVTLSLPGLEVVERVLARRPTSFPYVPGLLSFREIPAVLDAMERLHRRPDVLLCDGQGIAHPRRLGVAAHLGVLLDMPSIGVAKSRLIGTHGHVPNHRGAWVQMHDGEECVGAVLRTRVDVKPVYVSVGHRVSLHTAIDVVMRAVTRYRLPETTRQADRLASAPAHARNSGR
ncbi:MAG: deoxyribonuclease V [Acidihalobacter sp.]|jgi:deoxyribonuclease V|uniref:deoxyribonuclease V n=1 Tax=Acidihalobacter sp. TaxID=1872108 RepID=UPI00307CC916